MCALLTTPEVLPNRDFSDVTLVSEDSVRFEGRPCVLEFGSFLVIHCLGYPDIDSMPLSSYQGLKDGRIEGILVLRIRDYKLGHTQGSNCLFHLKEGKKNDQRRIGQIGLKVG